MMEGLGADSEEKHEPAGNIDTAVMNSLKVLDPNRPIREATELQTSWIGSFVPLAEVRRSANRPKNVRLCHSAVALGAERRGVSQARDLNNLDDNHLLRACC
jgi:hypothetical protein